MGIIIIAFLVIWVGKILIESVSFYKRFALFIKEDNQEFVDHLPFTKEIISIGFRRFKIILVMQVCLFLFFSLYFIYMFIPAEWLAYTILSLVLNAIFIFHFITMLLYAKQDWTQKKLLYNEESVMFRGIKTMLISNREEEVKFFEANNQLMITGILNNNDERRRNYFKV